MYIEEIILENDKRIFAGLGLIKLKIDFNNKNDLNLILGDNGTGKSSLESSLSPFANEVIREGYKGRKKIVYKKKNCRIEVEHIYTPKKEGHNCKHYIYKIKSNKKENLNENGNLSTFLEAVEDELGITPLQMELIQLGVDMKSIIDKQPSERKKYVSKFVDDVQIYLKKHDEVNNKLKTIDNLLKNYVASLNKLGNKENIEDDLFDTKQIILKLNNDKENYIKNIGIVNNSINELNNYLQENESIYDKYLKLKEFEEKNNFDLSYEQISEKINNLEKENLKLDKEISLCEFKIAQNDSEKKRITNELSESDNMLNLLSYNDIDDDYKDKLLQAKEENKNLEQFISEDYQYIYDNMAAIKLKINAVVNYNKNIEVILNNTSDNFTFYSFSIEELESQIIKEKTNLNKLSSEILKNTIKITEIKKDIEKVSNIPENCFNLNCPFILNKKSKEQLENELNIYNNEYNSLKEKEVEINNKISDLETSSKINRQISLLITVLIENEKLSNSIMKNSINNYSDLYTNITNNKFKCDLINIDIINNYLNTISVFIKNKKFIEDIEKDEEENKKYKKISIENKKLHEKIINIDNELKIDLSNKENYLLKYNSNTEDIKSLNEYKENIKEFKNKEEIIKVSKEYDFKKGKIDSYKLELNELTKKLCIINDELDRFMKQKENCQSKLKQIREIEKAKNVLDSYYLDCKMVRDSLSTNKGIPTIKIDSYMQQIKYRANEILKDCFENELFQFDKFVINAKEFRLPILNSGDGVEDISKCSAGQKALGMLAISLAIFEKTGSKYDIISLDEVDGQLDETKRRNFLKIVKEKTEEMGIKQIFLISHNKAFNDVDSNYILFKGADVDSINNQKNIIFKF